GMFQVSPEIRSRLKFQSHNLFHAWPGTDRFDLILVRNVLIYFKGPDQEKVVANAVSTLTKEGALIIGESESLTHIKTDLKAEEPLIYRFADQLASIGKAS
ncbi:MAG: hypothetical protein JNJ49_13910, partial [Bdellovibrionaceae bacterium]|nr:hypothetical protein [Pseudobdellovibrionaceae bacterium]